MIFWQNVSVFWSNYFLKYQDASKSNLQVAHVEEAIWDQLILEEHTDV